MIYKLAKLKLKRFGIIVNLSYESIFHGIPQVDQEGNINK